MKKIGILTSGGDSPGMNAAIRAVVRMAAYQQIEVVGIRQGFKGLLNKNYLTLEKGSVADIIHRGGTILQTARCDEFYRKEKRVLALENLLEMGIEGLIVIGGNGSLRAANLLSSEGQIPIIGIPATIDNDIGGTDFTIGYDTALNTIIDAVNKVRDTATSHERIFLVEVMGRERGCLALYAGLAAGAESILIPEIQTTIDDICHKLEQGFKRGKKHSIIIVTEKNDKEWQREASNCQNHAFTLGKAIKEKTGHETRVIILGHLQRGGSPSGRDRILASLLGAEAVTLLIRGAKGVMVGIEHEKAINVPLHIAWENVAKLSEEVFRLAHILSL